MITSRQEILEFRTISRFPSLVRLRVDEYFAIAAFSDFGLLALSLGDSSRGMFYFLVDVALQTSSDLGLDMASWVRV